MHTLDISLAVDAPTAALFLLMLDLPEVAVTCPDCRARGRRWDSETIACDGIQKAERYAASKRAAGWQVIDGQDHDGRTRIVCSRPCPTCTIDGQPLGRVQREPARLLLDAAPRTVTSLDSKAPAMHTVIETEEPGDPIAREDLAVLADRLQADGDKRGEFLALWLRGPEWFDLGDVELELQRLAMRLWLANEMAKRREQLNDDLIT